MKFLFVESITQQSQFTFITWPELVKHIQKPPFISTSVPQIAKKCSLAITASDAPDKRKETILEHDNFTLLRLDLDDTEHSVTSIKAQLDKLSIASYIIHTTASHSPTEGRFRYRVYIQLDHGINFDEWRILQTYLCFLFGADDCSNRPQQIMFLPVRFKGDAYEYFVQNGDPLESYYCPVYLQAIEFDVNQKREAEEIQKAKATHVSPMFTETLLADQVSIIDCVEQGYDWPYLLEAHGYKRQGRAWLPPESTSKIAGAYLLTGLDGKLRYYSHHTSDPCATGKALDKFDFITQREFNGDGKACFKFMLTQFPDHAKYNAAIYNKWLYAEFENRDKTQDLSL